MEHDEEFAIAGLSFRAIHVRGHSADSFCYLADLEGRRTLFAGGVEGYRSDLPRLAGLGVDALLPGHGLFTLRNGQQHIDAALEQAAGNPMPRQIGQGDLIV